MENIKKLFTNVNKEDKKIFLALAADYGNIGDIALTIAQEKIIKTAFPDRKIIEIPMSSAFEYENEIKNILNKDDILTVIGGGNMGNVYLGWENRRRFIIQLFKNNKTISFPQSIDFLENENGQEEFKRTIDIYSKHNDLTILAREEKSYNIMKNNFKNNVHLVPDSVLYLKNKLTQNIVFKRENITLCLRNDREKVTDMDLTNGIINILNKNGFNNIKITDTHLGEVSIESKDREKIFDNLLSTFENSKVVITDRLHGMIFSVITNTPCIVFDNSNKKISSTYHTWLKDSPLIKFTENYDETTFINDVIQLANIENPNINLDLDPHFEKLFDSLKG